MKRIVFTIVLAVGIVAMLSAFDGRKELKNRDFVPGHQMCQKNMNKQPDMDFGWILQKLDLSDAQKKKIEDTQIKHQKAMIQLEADIDILKLDKQAAMMENDFAKMKKVAGNIYDLKKTAALKRIEQQEAVWNVLANEQKTKAAELRKEKPKMKQQQMMDCGEMTEQKEQGMRQHKKLEHCKDQ